MFPLNNGVGGIREGYTLPLENYVKRADFQQPDDQQSADELDMSQVSDEPESADPDDLEYPMYNTVNKMMVMLKSFMQVHWTFIYIMGTSIVANFSEKPIEDKCKKYCI